jgi:hypothetical protein
MVSRQPLARDAYKNQHPIVTNNLPHRAGLPHSARGPVRSGNVGACGLLPLLVLLSLFSDEQDNAVPADLYNVILNGTRVNLFRFILAALAAVGGILLRNPARVVELFLSGLWRISRERGAVFLKLRLSLGPNDRVRINRWVEAKSES